MAPPPPPAVTAVVSVATLQPDISPGELVSIMGTNLSTPPITSQYDGSGLYPTLLGNTKVTFNGTPAPLLYVSTGQVDAVVPYGVAGANSLNVIVTHYGVASPAFSIPLVDTSPGICIASQSCSKEGGILNAASRSLNMVTPNNAEIPAPKGSAITIFATGAGLWKRSVPDGSVVLNAFPPSVPFSLAPAAPVSLTIGGLPATILYAGSAPFKVSGVLQVNAVVPDGVDSGPQPVVLTIGERNNSQQQLTVAVQ